MPPISTGCGKDSVTKYLFAAVPGVAPQVFIVVFAVETAEFVPLMMFVGTPPLACGTVIIALCGAIPRAMFVWPANAARSTPVLDSVECTLAADAIPPNAGSSETSIVRTSMMFSTLFAFDFNLFSSFIFLFCKFLSQYSPGYTGKENIHNFIGGIRCSFAHVATGSRPCDIC